ncbi:fasciclin domain-containing protein [Tranquillimonas rosea]|uniref:fasciclin domain-containing protein n=1 Tax=Tranquillimonas rosea TaxID=641238 RepID=UPI003BAC2C40
MIRRTFIALTATTALAAPAFADNHDSGDMAEMNIVETAQENGNFTTLLAAAEAAGLAETLSGEGPYTVFAPTDDAFDALPDGTVESLLADTEQLTSILTYHVIPSAVMSGDLEDGMTAETVNGESVEISIDGDTVMVDGATVTQADIEASNGVIHVVDTVLMPGEGSGDSDM